MIRKSIVRTANKRASTSKQRKHQHLLDVKVRAKRVSAQRTQKIVFFFCALLLSASVLGGIVFGARHVSDALFFANRDYALKNIDITTDGNLSRDTVLRVGKLTEGQNLFCIDLPKLQERLTSLPQVEDCKIKRIIPNKIAIAIQERRPVAWAVPASKTNSFNYEDSYLVDRQGILLKTKSLAPEYLGLPLIMGVETNNLQAGQPLDRDDVKSALELLQVSSEILKGRLQIQSIDLSKGYCLVVTDKQ
ncbi:MAG: FtsQ-type POTRA domain-containing protein, partial [Verrucomicrobia bacterium]|nr:FtsQ-type POTRA domain-containing protein [Verrucomicrobiota bacterium]